MNDFLTNHAGNIRTENLELKQRILELEADATAMASAFSAVIEFTLEHDDLDFLRLWDEGNFDALRNGWPEAPDDIYLAEATQESGDG